MVVDQVLLVPTAVLGIKTPKAPIVDLREVLGPFLGGFLSDLGRYGFSNAVSGSGTGVAYNVAMLLPNMNYQVRVASGQAPITPMLMASAD